MDCRAGPSVGNETTRETQQRVIFFEVTIHHSSTLRIRISHLMAKRLLCALLGAFLDPLIGKIFPSENAQGGLNFQAKQGDMRFLE